MKSFDKYSRHKELLSKATKKNKQNTIKKMTRTFELYKNEIPTCVEVPVSPPFVFPVLGEMAFEEIVVNDIVINDSRSGDEKLVKTNSDSTLDVGGYFYMDNYFWLIKHKDSREMDTMKTFTARRCNQYINHKHNGLIYKIPVSIEYMVMTSDGIQYVKYGSTLDSQRIIWMGSNDITDKLTNGTKLVIANCVFEITQINNYELNGLGTGTKGVIKVSATQRPATSSDDLDNGVADNDVATNIIDENTITGEKVLYTNMEGTYTSTETVRGQYCWVCDNDDVEFIENDEDHCVIYIPRDKCDKNIGATISLSKCTYDGSICTYVEDEYEVECTVTIEIRGV